MPKPTPTLPENPTAADCAKVARHLYRDAKLIPRLLMSYRPYICPFESLVELVPRGSRVLDIGCGGGLMLALLATSGRIESGYGFDTNGPMIRIANVVAQKYDLPLSFETRSATQCMPEGTYDVISCIDVMHHIPSKAQAGFFEDIVAHLPLGGKLIYKDIGRKPIWRASANRMHDLVLSRQWINYLPIHQVRQWALNLGLQVNVEQSYSRLWYGHELLVLLRPA